jgi:O-6-methylguanine DNA methyltransferase
MRDLESEAIAQQLMAALPEPEAPRPEHKAELAERLLGAARGGVRGAARGEASGAGPAPSGEPVRYTVVSAEPLGPAYLAYTDQGICFLTTASAGEAEFVTMVRNRYGCEAVRDDSRRERWQGALERWLAGKHQDVPLDLSRVTLFERTVLQKAQEIHRGAVRPYQWLAKEVGKPGASRAVGGVMARNPIPLFIPCHRVVAASGVIGNYSMGGPVIKQRLLELEGVDVGRLHALARQGYRYKASRTTGIFCYPTCLAIQPQHEVLFRTADDALAAGFRPCKVCKPN